MSRPFHRYKGFKPFKMDPKLRVFVPTAWRPEAGGSLFLQLSKEHEMPVVKVLSQEAYDERVERILASDKSPVAKDRLLGKLAMFSIEAGVNDQGKLAVPKEWSEQAGLGPETEVILAGRGLHFEIWSRANFDIKLGLELAQTGEDDDLGIF